MSQEKLKALEADATTRRLKKMRQARGIMKESDENLSGLLNDDQKRQYEEVKQEMRERMKERRNENAH
jgi:hypothetical protein